jgi:hypothetical protein
MAPSVEANGVAVSMTGIVGPQLATMLRQPDAAVVQPIASIGKSINDNDSYLRGIHVFCGVRRTSRRLMAKNCLCRRFAVRGAAGSQLAKTRVHPGYAVCAKALG